MSREALFALRFYAPLLGAAFILLLLLVVPRFRANGGHAHVGLEVGILGIRVPLHLWLQKPWIVRSVLLAAAAGSVLFALGTDVTEFFPERLQMDVYFDLDGLRRNVEGLLPTERTALRLAPNWHEHVREYDNYVWKDVLALWRRLPARLPRVDLDRAMLHGRGTTEFAVRRIGAATYRIERAGGRVDFELEAPHQQSGYFTSFFMLRDTPANYIRPSLREVLKGARVLLRPEFRQVLAIAQGDDKTVFNHVVIGVTPVSMIPFPEFGDTLYLWRLQDGSTVPVAYAVYYPVAGENPRH